MILVPVLGRAQQIEPLLENLARVTREDYRVAFICSPSDEEALEFCMASEADVVVTDWEPGRADFAKKINLGYQCYRQDSEWFFQAATDLLFHEAWDAKAMEVAVRTTAGVIGTNDRGNALVKRGHHSTHTFFSRTYIEAQGGTLDGTGVVFSETYDHQYVDNEFVQTAMSRGQWAFSRLSIVEHLHPLWRKGVMDSTYEKAMRETKEDSELYLQRVRTLLPRRARGRG